MMQVQLVIHSLRNCDPQSCPLAADHTECTSSVILCGIMSARALLERFGNGGALGCALAKLPGSDVHVLHVI